MYQPYVDCDYYESNYEGAIVPSDCLNKSLKKANRHIDILTYNRIVGKGFEGLTKYQQDIIKECVCELADFEYENQDMIESVLQTYALNGVSMSFGNSWNVRVQNGVAIKNDTYAKLVTTGLCYPGIR